jgi:hypothetical protein
MGQPCGFQVTRKGPGQVVLPNCQAVEGFEPVDPGAGW